MLVCELLNGRYVDCQQAIRVFELDGKAIVWWEGGGGSRTLRAGLYHVFGPGAFHLMTIAVAGNEATFTKPGV